MNIPLSQARQYTVESPIGAYEITVSLPFNYEEGKDHPLLVVTDPNLCLGTAIEAAYVQSQLAEIDPPIILGVGSPTSEGQLAWQCRRIHDMVPGCSKETAQALAPRFESWQPGIDVGSYIGNVDKFLGWLEDKLLPGVFDEYRVNRDRVGLFGHSCGGAMCIYSLLSGSSVFNHYIIGTFGTDWWTDGIDPEIEKFAANFGDRTVKAFAGAGGGEIADLNIGQVIHQCFGTVTKLKALNLPGLQITQEIFPNHKHGSVIAPLIASGLLHIWGTNKNWDEHRAAG